MVQLKQGRLNMTKKTNNSFEERMNRLKEIVSILEKGDTELDKSLDLYKEGLDISKDLKNELTQFETKIEKLNKDNEQ